MSKKSRRRFGAEFKTKVVLEALRERSILEELARKYELHPNQITLWKKEFLENASVVFEKSKSGSVMEEREKEKEELYNQIGVQNVEINWLKKSWEYRRY